MSTDKAPVTATELVEEAKKRIVLLSVCVVGLSYLMSLTSSSVLVNVPAALVLIIVLRYFALDFDMRRKAAVYNSKPASANNHFQKKYEAPKFVSRNSEWRRKVNSPAVEDALDHFSRHLVSEWVTDLWYSRITPDKQAPEELVRIINSVLAEIASRMRNIDLIDLLTRDVIRLFCAHLELFRACNVKIQKRQLGSLTIGQRDRELKYVLAAQNKLHPALFSTEAEHKVLQHLMEGLVSLSFRPDDLHCSLFRYIVRELLSCAVMRPVLNLANPRFINERIEGVAMSSKKADKVVVDAQQVKSSESSKMSTVHISQSLDPSVKGVELVQVKKDQPNSSTDSIKAEDLNGGLSKDPLLSIGTQSTRSWNSLPFNSQTSDGRCIQRHPSGGEWGDKLDVISRRKTEALAPEHFENVWAKGRNYKKKEGADSSPLPVEQSTSVGLATPVDDPKSLSKYHGKSGAEKGIAARGSDTSSLGAASSGVKKLYPSDNWSKSGHPRNGSPEEDNEDSVNSDDAESGSTSSFSTDDESSNITGLDTPSIKVWDGRNNRNQSVTRIHHPLEISKGHKARKTSKGRVQSQRLVRSQSGRKKPRSGSQVSDVWQEIERTSVSMEGQDILKPFTGQVNSDSSGGDSETESLGRTNSGATTSSSLSYISIPESHSLASNTPVSSLLADSFLTLRCEVVCANIVKSGSSTFAVYSISVTDVENKSWSIKRRFRHFEELHRRLKEYPEYTFHLPPKHFLSTGLDVPVIRERCKLLDAYLKKLLQLPTISGSIEVWDFLSVDSQTYSFSDSISIIETLSDDTSYDKKKEIGTSAKATRHTMDQKRGLPNSGMKEAVPQMRINHVTDLSRMNTINVPPIPPERQAKAVGKPLEDSGKRIDRLVQDKIHLDSKLGTTVKEAEIYQSHPATEPHVDGGADPALPSDWIPPNLSVPILDLVDVLFQLHDGGWIRRKAFWVAKQVLQLGMGDAFDDWLIEKIQILRRGSVVASGIRRVEQILWPDGIFLTKHPKRQRPTPSASSYSSPSGHPPSPLSSPKEDDIRRLDELQENEARRREQFVYELMIDKAPTALVGLVGRKEYDHCAKDLYYFLQSSVCLKQLAFGLLELLLLSAFPELENHFRQLIEEKDKFGELQQS
ncbi:hypothetical protein ACET3Z_007630 [Daucus carota]